MSPCVNEVDPQVHIRRCVARRIGPPAGLNLRGNLAPKEPLRGCRRDDVREAERGAGNSATRGKCEADESSTSISKGTAFQ